MKILTYSLKITLTNSFLLKIFIYLEVYKALVMV